MHIRFRNKIATPDGIIRVYASINKAKQAMRPVAGRVADDTKMFQNMRRTYHPDTKVYREEQGK